MLADPALSGACDCHVHVVGPLSRFPQTRSRTYTAELATLDSLQEKGKPCGVARWVIVQASFHSTDNSCLLETLDALGVRGRGVAAVELESVTSEKLKEFAARGVRGLRLNLYSKSLATTRSPLDLLRATIDKLPDEQWHVEIIASLPILLTVAREMAEAPAKIVLDHYGLPGELEPESSAGQDLLRLIASPHVWVKLSAPYRILANPLATKPPTKWLAALLRVAPDRCVWGSDWPHTPLERDQRGPEIPAPYRKLEYRRLFEDFVTALPDTRAAKRILVQNPSRLYGFGN